MPARAARLQALRLPRSLSTNQRNILEQILTGLPIHFGNPVSLSVRPELTNYRGNLLSAQKDRGKPVYAACFVRQRRIVLESTLFQSPDRLRLICVHECFHLVWPRLGNPLRAQFAQVLKREFQAHARGELGESALVRKSSIETAWSESGWKDYVCEAFCDTGAYLYSYVTESNDFTLAPRWVAQRKLWFARAIHWEAKCF